MYWGFYIKMEILQPHFQVFQVWVQCHFWWILAMMMNLPKFQLYGSVVEPACIFIYYQIITEKTKKIPIFEVWENLQECIHNMPIHLSTSLLKWNPDLHARTSDKSTDIEKTCISMNDQSQPQHTSLLVTILIPRPPPPYAAFSIAG